MSPLRPVGRDAVLNEIAMIMMLAPIESLGPLPVNAASLVVRLKLTALALVYALAMVPALVLAIFTVLAIPLGLVTVGFGIALAVVPATAALTSAHRRASGRLLGARIGASYSDTTGTTVVTRPIRWLRDPARWRDAGFLCFSATIGFLVCVIPPALLAAPVVHLALGVAVGGWLWWLVPLGVVLLALWWLTTPALLRFRALAERVLLDRSRLDRLEHRVEQVVGSRADALDDFAAEVRRIERDLHDGAQARIAAVGMSVGLAEKLVRSDPDAALQLLREARDTNVDALEDLRSVVRGILPPMLTDRGLAGAVEALGLALPLPTTVIFTVPRLSSPVESAVYFAVAELVSNTVKHADATRVSVHGNCDDTVLTVVVQDDGCGGADATCPGLAGIARRLAAFDGTLRMDSPDGGPTTATILMPWRAT